MKSNCADGEFPYAGLAQGSDGNFYGTTVSGGITSPNYCVNQGFNGCGTVFKITPEGTLTTLYDFCSQGGSSCTDGAIPCGGLVQGSDGNLYGTTTLGGANDTGTVFKMTTTGTPGWVYSFGPTDPSGIEPVFRNSCERWRRCN